MSVVDPQDQPETPAHQATPEAPVTPAAKDHPEGQAKPDFADHPDPKDDLADPAPAVQSDQKALVGVQEQTVHQVHPVPPADPDSEDQVVPLARQDRLGVLVMMLSTVLAHARAVS
jgi:hypothetical protein